MIILFDWGIFFFQCDSNPKSWKCGSKSCLGRTRFILERLCKAASMSTFSYFFLQSCFLFNSWYIYIKKNIKKESLCRAPVLNSNCSSVRFPVKMSSKTIIPFATVKMSLCLKRSSCLLWTTDSSSAGGGGHAGSQSKERPTEVLRVDGRRAECEETPRPSVSVQQRF